jgi:tRNA nucleotidyltransferase (CCA-adding enzyme)
VVKFFLIESIEYHKKGIMKIYLVGGAVRDHLLGLPVQERDWVVVGATLADMQNLGYRMVGKDFPVFLHPKTNEEYALARIERKIGPGYKGFSFETSQYVTLADDLQRRDLTINAMAQDENGSLIDPYQGQRDLEHKILRHVSPAFSEDPVRILRVARFMARYAQYGFHVAKETIELMRSMVKSGEINALVPERIFKELQRALLESNPEIFFNVLAECNALPILFPHLKIDGPGLSALKKASSFSDGATRLAVLLHALPEDSEHINHSTQEIKTICKKFALPKDYQQLVLLTASHYKKALAAQTVSPKTILTLFSALDIFRRKERFIKFLNACSAIASAKTHSFDPAWLARCAEAVTDFDVKPLLEAGLTGSELAIELKEKREHIIKNCLIDYWRSKRIKNPYLT